mgnify:CR=1 FL=1
MTYREKYGNRDSSQDKPAAITADALKVYPPDVEPALEGCDFASLRELATAYREAWSVLAGDRYLLNKRTRQDMPDADVLLTRAKRISSSADADRKTFAAAESLWLRKFERKELTRRRNAVFSHCTALTKASFRRCGTARKKRSTKVERFCFIVIRLGFEPKTHSLEGCCSIQLSYRTDL